MTIVGAGAGCGLAVPDQYEQKIELTIESPHEKHVPLCFMPYVCKCFRIQILEPQKSVSWKAELSGRLRQAVMLGTSCCPCSQSFTAPVLIDC